MKLWSSRTSNSLHLCIFNCRNGWRTLQKAAVGQQGTAGLTQNWKACSLYRTILMWILTLPRINLSHTSYACNSGPICIKSPYFKCPEPSTPACCPVCMCKREREMICKDKTAGTDCCTHTALGVRFSLYVSSVNDLELFPSLPQFSQRRNRDNSDLPL